MKSTNKVCVDCNDLFLGRKDKCRKCQRRAVEKKRYANPEIKARMLAAQRIRRQDPAVKARNKATNDRWRLAKKNAAAKQELTPEQIAERKREWARNYYQNKKAAKVVVQDERPPGTRADGTWRCPGCGGKMLGRVKRCLPCELTKQDDSNEQKQSGKYQTV
jgi:predicted RNA-binding Zn-ribbon protein involved in translation (DUF1610 family)